MSWFRFICAKIKKISLSFTDFLGQWLASKCVNIHDFRKVSRWLLPKPIYSYLDGGADDEVTLLNNNRDFAQYELLPKYLIDISSLDITTRVMNCDINFPLVLSPTGMSRLFHPDGELAVAKAAKKAGLIYSLSTLSTRSIEEVAKVSDVPKWFQIYVFKDRNLVADFFERCRNSDFVGMTLTIDVPPQGNREKDVRYGFTIPPKINLARLLDYSLTPLWSINYLMGDKFELANVSHRSVGDSDLITLMKYLHEEFDFSVTWEDAEEMIKLWDGPFAIKGISSVSDAKRAVEVGATTLILSNHGGRQLDSTVTPIGLLPEVRRAVGEDVELILDGGVRRGSDIFKALALGANACSIGRPYLYGLATNGEQGVFQALNILKTEFERTMGLMGITSVGDINRGCIRGRKVIE